MFKLLLKTQFIRIFHSIFKNQAKNWIRIFGGVGLGVLFLSGIYSLVFFALKHFYYVPILGPILIGKLLSLIFLTFFALILFSNIIYTISTTYLSDDLMLLNSLPIDHKDIVLVKFLETWVDSSWMPILVFIPILGAYGGVCHASIAFYFWCGVILLFFLIIPSAVGFTLTSLLMCFFSARKVRDLLLLVSLLAFCSVFVILRLSHPENILKSTQAMQSWVLYLQGLKGGTAPFLPSDWASSATMGALFGRWNEFKINLIFLLLAAVLCFGMCWVINPIFFFKGWCNAQEGNPVFRKKVKYFKDANILEKLLPKSFYAMLVKDYKIFIRDSAQWSQLLLLLSLVVVYLYNYQKLPLNDYAGLKNVVYFLSIGFTGFIVTAITTRYVFPNISLEGKAFWILKSSPISVKELMIEKGIIAFFPIFFLSEITIIFSAWIMKVDHFMLIISLITMAVFSIGLTSLGIGMGATFTYFKIDNAPKISTSFGGLVYMMISVTFIFLNLIVEANPVRIYYLRNPDIFLKYPWEFFIPCLTLIFLNCMFIVLPVWWGCKKLNEQEI